ncbi:MAG TPA: hypothetical protein VK017_11265, partial [Sphingobacterium sp.]|nr:hypothetical protein [Sphingobacterium sp.]
LTRSLKAVPSKGGNEPTYHREQPNKVAISTAFMNVEAGRHRTVRIASGLSYALPLLYTSGPNV